MMNLAYIAGAFRASTIEGIERNVHVAAYWAAKINVAGKGSWFAHCPHTATKEVWLQMESCHQHVPDQFWLDGDLLVLRHVQLIVLTPGWFNSEDSMAELKFAIHHNIEQLEVYPETQLDSLTIKLKEIANAIHLKRSKTSS